MNISNTLVTLDLETTGTWIEKDKIIEIALIKLSPDGSKEVYDKRVNPGIVIPAAVTELTGISDADVKDAPSFKDIAQEVLSFIEGADFVGFNVERFDLPLLEREMREAGHVFIWHKAKIYDVQKVYHLNEKRDLQAAYKFYCNQSLENAHSALADAQATIDILFAQAEKYGEGEKKVESLSRFQYQDNRDFFDAERKFCWWNGELYPAFGKYARKTSLQELSKRDPGYLKWMGSKDFGSEVKDLIKNALQGKFPVKESAK